MPQVAEAFQTSGITALVYDPRNTGESEGRPRNEIDPAKQVSDYSDALSFLLDQPNINPDQIAFWGMSFSATVALCAASLDKRAKMCIAVCPFLDLIPPPERIPPVVAKVMAERQSQIAGNPPTYLSMLNKEGRNPAGLPYRPTEEEMDLIATAQERGAANFDNRCTLETYYNFLMWQPKELMKLLMPTPVFMLVPELDTWSPPEKQVDLFQSLKSPKKLHLIPGKGHLTFFDGADFLKLMQMQVEFLGAGFDGHLQQYVVE